MEPLALAGLISLIATLMASLIGMGTVFVRGKNGNGEVMAAIQAIGQQLNAQAVHDSATREDIREIKWLLVANGKAIENAVERLSREGERRRS